MSTDRGAHMSIGKIEIWLYLTGILAAAQFGKMPALMPSISAELGIGLFAGAMIISLIEVSGALLAFPAAGFSARLRHWRTLLAAIALLVAGGAAQTFSGGSGTLLFFRAIESVGYLGVIVSAPVLMAREAERSSASLALVLWSTFLPVGLAVGSITSGIVGEEFGWRIAILLWSVLGCGLLILTPSSRSRGRQRDGSNVTAEATWPAFSAIVAALGFGSFTCFQVGLLGLFPEYLVSEKSASIQFAGLIAGLGGLATVSGVAVPFWISRRSGGASPNLSLPLLLVSLILPAVLLFPVYSEELSLVAVVVVFLLLNVISGILPAIVFAALPRLGGKNGIGPANGILAQAGALGSLSGPPLYAFWVSISGWTAAGGFGLAMSILAMTLLYSAGRIAVAAEMTEFSKSSCAT